MKMSKFMLAAALAVASLCAGAASDVLTSNQLTTMRAGVCANGAASPFMQAPGNSAGLQAWLNTSTGGNAWGVAVDAQTSDEAPTYTTYDALSAGKRDSWVRFLAAESRNYSKKKVQDWIVDIWGAATANSNAEKILQAAIEPLTNGQSIIGGTTRTTGTVSGLDRTYYGLVSATESTQIIYRDNGTLYGCP